ncbi:hypothetical protein F4808DRAFT_461608 [Astrocystis sublimbata]|nr:hypothetical protein F4808DRAFT_461608 [Astrocystis sublimbata]
MEVQRKRLFILCDGTWQDGVNNRCPLTNVATLARCLSPVDQEDCLQLVYYDSGIGNGTSKLNIGIDGATGRGISAKIRNAYSFISHNYNFDRLLADEPDEIVLVGFSRGAFAVQCIASFINQTGLLHCQYLYYLRGLFTLWSRQDFKRWGPGDPNPVRTKLDEYIPKLKDEGILHEVKIKALVVWDTVSALGLPILHLAPRPLAFVGKQVPGIVENAFQALALDERRRKCQPRVWNSKEEGVRRVKQCWFMGTHADVGGNGDAALGAVTLLWMLGQLKTAQIGIAIENGQVAKHLCHKFLEWNFNINRALGQLKETSVLSSTSGPGKPTEPALYWWLLGMVSRGKYLYPRSGGENLVSMEIHFSVRLALARGAKCAILERWKTMFRGNKAEWKLGRQMLPECELSINPAGYKISDELDEYGWIQAWSKESFTLNFTERSRFAKELRDLVMEEGVSRGKLSDFAQMLREDMAIEGGKLAPSAVYPPAT